MTAEQKQECRDKVREALTNFVVKIAKKENATPEELRALVGAASVVMDT